MADTPEHEQSKTENKAEISSPLPAVESPSISPAVTEPAVEPKAEAAAETQPASEATAAAPPTPVAAKVLAFTQGFKLRPRHKRYGLLAASVLVAAALGAVVGATASGGFTTAPKPQEFTRVDDSKAMQQTIARLTRDVATLKASVEAASKSTQAQIAKIGDKLSEKLSREAADVTGSISAPHTMAVQPSPPVPLPKPRVAAVDPQAPERPPVLQDWIIRDVRDGYVYVQGRGSIFEVWVGAPLPGVGRVEQVKRQDGRWMVVTPKGIIVSLRDRRYFESF